MSTILNREQLIDALKEVSRVVELRNNVGSVIVSEYGARILGVFIGGRQNPLWVSNKPQETIINKDWKIGGNRLWISPERNFFYKKPDEFEDWFCPTQLDPGDWKIIHSDARSVVLEEEVELEDFIGKTKVSVSLSRLIMLRETDVKGLNCIRLRIRDSLIARNGIKEGLNLWSITQVRPGKAGTVIIPVRPKAKPVHYFGMIPKNRLKVSRNHVSFKIDGMAVYKLGVMPEDMPNPGHSVIFYYVEHGKNDVFLILMRTLMAPENQEECLDVAKANPSGPKGCVQSYNSDKDLCFGEMELHFKPAVKVKNTWISYADYDIEVFSGNRGEILKILRKNIPKPFLFTH
ncbi:MAG: hypothetical protein RMI79_03655 [Nitrososphaerota archaeon]|nr:hypothetical protein [Nitrososphaerota archaeon]